MSDIAEQQFKKELEKLTEEYIDLYEGIDKEIYSYINKYYINVTKSVFKLYNYHSISRSVLNNSDKDLYTNAKQVMSNYKTLIKTYKDMEGYYSQSMALYLVDEIIGLIANQYKVFEEETSYVENPINNEKNQIIDKYALKIAQEIALIEEEFIEGKVINAIYNLKNTTSNDYQQQFNIINNVKNNIQIERIFKAVSRYLTKGIYELDDLENREETKKYFMFLKYQQQLLVSIISEQITRLDQEIGKPAYDESIKIFISLIINQVIETYELVETYVANIERAYRIAPIEQGIEMQYEVFEKSFDGYFDKEKKVSLDVYLLNEELKSIESYKEKAFDLIKSIVKECKRPTNPSSTYSLVKKNYNATLDITNRFLDKLSKLQIYAKGNQQLLKTSKEYEIVEGIQQTMEIKTKVLSENRDILQRDLDENIEDLNYDIDKLQITINERAIDIYFKNLKSMNIKNYIDKYIESLMKSKQCNVDVEDLEIDAKELEKRIIKKLFDFKKETLFYEISTFDEVLYYSIEKIRVSDNLNVKKYIMYIDDTKEKLTKTLEKNNIKIISPKPKEKFNSKEHKVIIAEEKEGFAKGDIIKVNTVGYKEYETVILKANVIAAR